MDDNNYYENMIAELRVERDALAADLAAVQDELRDLDIELTRARRQRDIAHTLLRDSKQWMICPGKYTAWEIMERIDAALAGEKNNGAS